MSARSSAASAAAPVEEDEDEKWLQARLDKYKAASPIKASLSALPSARALETPQKKPAEEAVVSVSDVDVSKVTPSKTFTADDVRVSA